MGEDRQGRAAAQRGGSGLTHTPEGTDPGETGSADARRIVQVVPLVGARALASRVFDYRVPPEFSDVVGRGSVVVVPFGRRMVRGVVVAEQAPTSPTSRRLLALSHVAGRRLDDDLLALAEHLSERYLAPLGAALQAVTPPHLANVAASARTPRQIQWLVPTLPAERVSGPDSAEPYAGPAARPLTVAQQRLLGVLPAEGLPLAAACRTAGVGRGVAEGLVERGAAALVVASAPAPDHGAGPRPSTFETPASAAPAPVVAPELSREQQQALASLRADLDGGGAVRRLLWGVTGSGKTEVYLALLNEVLRRGEGAIVLVPEIALTVQTIARLRARLGRRVGVLHSGLSAGQRAGEYDRIIAGEATIVVGARSAVFAPVAKLRMIVIDEAHDSSYKQEEEPRYDAREVAWWRVERAGGLLVEGSATPRLESVVEIGRPLRLQQRPTGGALPEVEVVDMRRQGAQGLLAPRARRELQVALAAGEQAIVLLNRRGYAAYLGCEQCGHVLMCPNCELALTYYRSRGVLQCRHCALQQPLPGVCPSCQEAALSRGTPGTERLTQELGQIVPDAQLFRLDSDVVTSGRRVGEVLAAFGASRPGVLVGTQMVAKGHDFPGVTLVVVADADTGLYLPDFRSAERTFALLTQVAGRAGRADRPGRVLVQTWNPEVPCIRMALAREESEFYRRELETRERLGYPPFRSLIRVVVAGGDEEKVRAGASYLADHLRPHLPGDRLRGPARLPMLRRRSRWHFVVAGEPLDEALALVRHGVERLREPYTRRGVDLVVDVDPQSFN